ncbi:MAG TPA: hypothetical protein VFZ62_01850 [Candidatus Saccharimonadales bacterium]
MQSTPVLSTGNGVITLTIAIGVVVLVTAIVAIGIIVKNKKEKRTKE